MIARDPMMQILIPHPAVDSKFFPVTLEARILAVNASRRIVSYEPVFARFWCAACGLQQPAPHTDPVNFRSRRLIATAPGGSRLFVILTFRALSRCFAVAFNVP